MHNVFKVEPSICGVRFLNRSQVDIQPELLTVEDWRPQELDDLLTLLKPAQPLLVFEAPLLLKPGGGPRALLIGAPQSSEVTAVGGGADSAHVFLELLRYRILRITCPKAKIIYIDIIINLNQYLVNALGVVAGGLNVHVELLKLGIDVSGLVVCGGGDVLLLDEKIASGSLIVAKDSGERTTEPGVMLGSSSMLFIWVP